MGHALLGNNALLCAGGLELNQKFYFFYFLFFGGGGEILFAHHLYECAYLMLQEVYRFCSEKSEGRTGERKGAGRIEWLKLVGHTFLMACAGGLLLVTFHFVGTYSLNQYEFHDNDDSVSSQFSLGTGW